MIKASGGFTGKANWQTSVSLPHLTNHQLVLAEVSGKLDNCSYSAWNGNVMTYWHMWDSIGDEGTYHNYYVVMDKDGDRAWGRSEGKTFTSGGQVKIEGTFKYDGGNGKYKNFKGKGTLKGYMVSPTEIRFDWEGEFEI